MQLVQLDMKQISSEAEIYDCLVGQMNFTNADEKPEWMNVIEMNERDPYEMDTEEQPEDPEFKKILETPEKTLDGLVQMLAARLADDYCLEVIRDEAADDEKKELEKPQPPYGKSAAVPGNVQRFPRTSRLWCQLTGPSGPNQEYSNFENMLQYRHSLPYPLLLL